MGIMDPIRSWGEPLIDEWAEKLGAKCKHDLRERDPMLTEMADTRSADVWGDFVVADGRIVTGQNPQSARSAARAALAAWQNLQ